MIRKDPQPILIEAKTFRVRGHEEASGTKYVPKKLIEKWEKRDPVKLFESKILKEKIITQKECNQIQVDIKNKKRPLSNIGPNILFGS